MHYASGWIYLDDHFVKGSVGFEDGIIKDISRQWVENPIAKGMILPTLTNAHTHIGDAFITEELEGSLHELVAPPDGLKHRKLQSADRENVIVHMKNAGRKMLSAGTAHFCDFREGGLAGVSMLLESLTGMPLRSTILGRPSSLVYDREELSSLLKKTDGIGVSSLGDWSKDDLMKVATDTHKARKKFALHASEGKREDIDDILDLEPDFLIHMTMATDDDLRLCAESDVPVAICPRSNAFFGILVDIPRLLKLGVTVMLGTDNAMISSPSILREMEFAYRIGRLKGKVAPKDIFNMVITSRKVLNGERTFTIQTGYPPDFIVLDVLENNPSFKSLLSCSESDVSLMCIGNRTWMRKEGFLREIPLSKEETE